MKRLRLGNPELKIGDRVRYTTKVLVQKRHDISKPPIQGTIIGWVYKSPNDFHGDSKEAMVHWDSGSLLKTRENLEDLVKV